MLAFVTNFISAPGAVFAETIKIDPPVQISPPNSGGHFWGMGNTYAAPDDPGILITCGIRIRAVPLSWEGYLYESADGGLSWRAARIDSTLSDTGVLNQVSETACAIGRHGAMYMSTGVYGKWHSKPFQLVRSNDAGQTWSEPLQRRGWYDAARSVVDNSGGAFDGQLYIFSNRIVFGSDPRQNPCYPCYEPLLSSADHGRTLQTARAEKPGNAYVDPGFPSQATVLIDGKAMSVNRVAFVAPKHPLAIDPKAGVSEELGVEVLTSSDGGRSLDAPVTVSRWVRQRDDETTRLGEWGIVDIVTGLAVDRSSGPHRGRVYVAWRASEGADKSTRIMLAWSENSGKTWSKPIRADDAISAGALIPGAVAVRGTDPMSPCIAVNKDGTVGLLWMERLQMPEWRFAASLDGGQTFLPSVPVYTTKSPDTQSRTEWFNQYVTAQDHPDSPGPEFKPQRQRVGFTLYTQFMETGALTATIDGVFHPVWTTRSNGALWTTRIAVLANQARISPSIVGLRDVSDRVRLEAIGFSYDGDSRRLLVDVALVNTTSVFVEREPWLELLPKERVQDRSALSNRGNRLAGPLILRMTGLRSEAGPLHLAEFDGVDASGMPLLDWSAKLPPGGLAPGSRTVTRRLQFYLDELKSGHNPNVVRILTFEAQAYSR